MKKISLFTLGCKVNQYETQALREQFLRAGFEENNGAAADVYIINTCTVTHHADRESRRLIRKALHSNPKAKIIVTGCYVENDASEILQISDKIQLLPNQQKQYGISAFCGHERAFVKIQDGCDAFCAYCKIPLVRGRSRSRALEEIVQEAARLVNNGFKEIVLTGICLGDYHYQDYDLADVLDYLERIKGEFRIRLSSIEPHLVSEKLIEKIADSEKICPHLHIPLQSGDNAILRKMNRKYTQKDYLNLIARIKKKIKNVAITTDVLVGFPGEADKNFRNSVRCLKKILPLRTHIFPFSPRQGTAAFDFQGRIEPGMIKQRVALLKEVAAECSYKFRKRFLRKGLTVLIESNPDKQSEFFCGYSENYIRVLVKDASRKQINKLISVRAEKIGYSTTIGTIY